jgi:hypothetical protein
MAPRVLQVSKKHGVTVRRRRVGWAPDAHKVLANQYTGHGNDMVGRGCARHTAACLVRANLVLIYQISHLIAQHQQRTQ